MHNLLSANWNKQFVSFTICKVYQAIEKQYEICQLVYLKGVTDQMTIDLDITIVNMSFMTVFMMIIKLYWLRGTK